MDEYERRYLTDDRDLPEEEQNELVISAGGNGDWYVSVVPKGTGTLGKTVRLSTSGGAASSRPGLPSAMADAFRRMQGGMTAGTTQSLARDLVAAVRRVKSLTMRGMKRGNTSGELFRSLVAEIGELADAMNIEDRVFSRTHRELSEPSTTEAVDCLILSIAVYAARGGLLAEIPGVIGRKLDKWLENQNIPDERAFEA